MRRMASSLFRLWVVASGLLAVAPAWAQYKTLGPSKCTTCHDHSRQATKWQKEEPVELKGKAHFNTRKQLEAPKSAAFAKAAGLADPYDLKGSCVKCHATVFAGDANAGVSCESCHGASSGYLDLHQVKGSHAKSVAAGLKELKNEAAIAKMCVDCHVTPDPKLRAAGHPAGESWDAGVGLKKLVHWNAGYDFAKVSATGKTAIAAKLGGKAPPAAAAAPAAPPSAPAAPAAPPKTAGGPAAAPPSAPAAATPAPASPAAAPPEPAGEPAPWDWDQPVRQLPSDYVPDAATPAPAAPAKVRRTKRAPAETLSLAQDGALQPTAAGISDSELVAPAIEPAKPVEAGAGAGAAAPVGAPAAPAPPVFRSRPVDLRARAILLLDQSLRAKTRAPNIPPAQKPREFTGADGELLRLQDEALALAIEALRRPQ